jgi:CHASE2 domain-containing sensor protein
MTTFRLKIWRVEQTCIFELAWGAGLQITAQLAYPESLTQLYQAWQQSYLNFYTTSLRARVQGSGGIAAPTVDWRAQLVQAEARLLSEFYFWLSSAELLGIRSQIAQAASAAGGDSGSMKRDAIDVCLTCEPLELARFPWEAWEIGTEFGVSRDIRMARTPANLRETAVPRKSRGKLQVLAILGDDTGLNFQADRQALKSLEKVAQIEFVGWQAGRDSQHLKEEIAAAIADAHGWDILFFAGHSNETALTGGELTIAPGVSILIQEIAPQLMQARDLGLQFAIFNSCNGLSIANSLIDLGLSQVAIMREPIHNRVAQEFLLQFMQHLTDGQDAHESMIAACQFLKGERSLTYPSANLIPSLFHHPEAKPFQIQRPGIQQWLMPWLPSRKQAWALAAMSVLAILPPIQSLFLEPRIALQALYRDKTQQVPKQAPATLLVQIDEDSIRGLDARKINPIDRTYLAQVIDRTKTLNPKVVGIDFLLDRPTPEDSALSKSVKQATEQAQWLLFAATTRSGREVGAIPTIANPNWSLQGHVELYLHHLELPRPEQNCQDTCPFGYLLALTGQLQQTNQALRPNVNNPTPARDIVLQQVDRVTTAPQLDWLRRQKLPALTAIAEGFGQLWLRPILDYSIPPDRAFQAISAQQLLDSKGPTPGQHAIVIIAPGGYEQAGLTKYGEDNFPTPMAMRYWQGEKAKPLMTGAENHAYMVHHFLNQHIVTPIPALWLMGLAAIAGQGIVLYHRQRLRSGNRLPRKWVMGLGVGNVVYGITALQLYLSAGLVLPILLPSGVFWLYCLV